MVREGGLSGLPCPQQKRKAECMSRTAAPDAVHFTLDVQAIFAVRGFNPQKKIAIWAVDHTPILTPAIPLLRNVYHSQIERF